ncbi:MAG: hypothetical protein J6R84_02665 [Alistipes sp.]|nr:hypothetical protein [Alistipes sp.]MBO7343192.1 hypothetical protein [Alistipes sp.]
MEAKAKSNYKNFKVAIYTRAYEVQKMTDPEWLKSTWDVISNQVKVDKIYLETHRDLLIIKKDEMQKIIKFFKDQGIEVAGGITYTIDESNSFETFCYTDPKERALAQEIIELSASLFDEVILDDFFFTDCKCDLCVEAKGDRTWTEYRLELMNKAAHEVILGPAKKVNPNVKVIIKYPNWYDHFPALGFDLENGPKIFDGVYTGTETRDAVRSNQHLQPYLGYLVWRYYNNLAPGRNGGGWVDTGGMRTIDRYSEQLWITMFAKAPEITLFDYRQMLNPLSEAQRAQWQGQGTSFDFDKMMQPVKLHDKEVTPSTVARAAGYSLEVVDDAIGFLGEPMAIKSYKPYHSTGEDFLQNYFGMIGIPMDIVPEFPEDEEFIILTEQAKYDKDIVAKIQKQLQAGKDVMITSGLLRALQGKGIEKIVDMEYTDRKALINEVMFYGQLIPTKKPILMQQVQYQTNDSWEIISGMDAGLGWPIVHRGNFSKGNLYLFVIPDNFADLYSLPDVALNRIRDLVSARVLPYTIEGPNDVALYIYDNNTIVVESFHDEPITINVVGARAGNNIAKDMLTGDSIKASERQAMGRGATAKSVYRVTLKPHSFRVLRFE